MAKKKGTAPTAQKPSIQKISPLKNQNVPRQETFQTMKKATSAPSNPDASQNKSTVTWYRKLYDKIVAYYGYQNRPDLIYFVTTIILLVILLLSVKFWKVWDDRYGYMGGLSTKLKIFKTLGLNDIFSMKKPMDASQLETYFAGLRQAGKLDNTDIWRIKTMSSARQSHDAYFRLRPNFKDHRKSLLFQMVRLMFVQIMQIAMIVMPYFLGGYLIWAFLKYFTYWTKATLGFLLEVQYKFIIDWIKAEISKIFADIVNTIVKILTLGIKKGKAINVSMPTYSTYVNNWWKKYIKPLLDNVDDEYGCRVDEAKRSVAMAVGWIVLPLKTIYTWYLQLKKYGLDLPYDVFKEMVLRLYPQYVESNGRLADDLVALDKNFYEFLKRDLTHGRSSKRHKALLKTNKKSSSKVKASAQQTIDLRSDINESHEETCQVIK